MSGTHVVINGRSNVSTEFEVTEDVDGTYLVCKMVQQYQIEILKADRKYKSDKSAILRGTRISAFYTI